MSFSDNYYALLEEEKKRKKKKATEQKTGHSFTDTYNELMAEADIAPTVNTTTDAPLFTQRTAPFFERGVSLPVKTTVTKGEEEKDLVFFQKGAFEDGWDKGDLWKTILGTGADAIVGLGKGVSKLVEGVVDVGSYGVAGIADAFDSEEYADKVRKKAQKNAVDDYFADVDAFYDQYSVLGKTSDAIAEALGQVGGIILTGGLGAAAGLGAAGVTALTTTTMGLSSFGSGMGEAYAGGASDKEAATYGLIKGVVDAGSELIFGGLGKTVKALGLSRGLSSLDDMFARKLSSKLTNQVAKNFVEYGVKATAEGVEEVLAGLGSAIGKKLTYMSDEELNKLVKDENLLEQFVVGTVVSGFAQGGDLNASNKSNRDFVSGLSQNEQKVVDYEVQKRTDGQKLTNKQKNSIYDAVFRDMERGRISTDTIEEVLGGDEYAAYKGEYDAFFGGDTFKAYEDTIASEEAQIKELEAQIEALENEPDTIGNRNKYNALESQIEQLRNSTARAELKAQLDSEAMRIGGIKNQLRTNVSELVKDSRLAESYRELARSYEKYTADLSKYENEHAKKTIQNIMDSGVAVNTNEFHEFADWLAQISADKGMTFSATDAERLKGTRYDIAGKTIHGFIDENGNVTLNMDSDRAGQITVGHELTHVLEGTEFYSELQSAIKNYAISKMGLDAFNARLKETETRYKGIGDPDKELTADLIGEYIFTDTDFVRNLSVQNRNVFQKIYDEIKYLYKVATAGSKEARELEKVKRVFEEAYKSDSKAAETKSEDFYDAKTKYSLRVTDKNTLDFLDNQETVTTYKTMQLVDGKLYPPMASRIDGKFEDHSELGAWEQATEHPELIKNGNKFKLDKGKGQGSIEAAYNPYMHSSNLVLNDQFSGAYKRDNLVTVECEVPVSELTSGYHAELAKDSVGWHPWHTGTVAGQLRNAKGVERQVLLSRWIKPVRIVPDAEVAAKYKELLDGTNVEVPDNVVTPSLLQELKNAGVKIKESGRLKYSLSDSDGSIYERIHSMQIEVNNLNRSIKEMEDSADYKAQMDKLLEAIGTGNISNAISEYNEWVESSGYSALAEKRKTLQAELENLRNEFDARLANEAAEKEKAAIAKSGLSEAEYFRKQAVKEFGYTPYFYDAGYITTNGKMLNFSGEKGRHFGSRGQDHRAIGIIYENETGTDALNRFMRDGNIRIVAESPGLDISTKVEPSKEQYSTIRKFIYEYADKGHFSVDLSDENGSVVGSLQYENRINAERIIGDIKHYYATGEIRRQSGFGQFRYSLSNEETDKSYLSAVENGDMDTARQIMEKVAKRRGYTIHAYHGTARGDRVGNVFLPERATSGPMAFFTDSKEIAENYSKSKQDTSMAYDPDYDRYETQFRIKAGTLDIPLYRAWGYLPFDARRRITQKAGQLREDWDGDNELILDPDTNDANGGFQWQLKEARGNAIQALTEQWLNSGNLFNEEARFLEVLEMAGVTEEFKKVKGMGELYFKDPNAKHEKVYDTFLRIRKPFDTATVDEQFVADLEAWYDEQDQDQYVRENVQSDMWDKNGIDAYDFAERLRRDIENNTTHAWTSIPDSVTDYLKHLGYDGIKDAGGKFTLNGHTVWIPFASSQIKSAETVTYDDAGNVIPITERFDKKDVDIRQSLSNVGEEVDNHGLAPINKYKYGSQTYGKDIALETAPVEDIAPVQEGTVSETETVAENATVDENLFPDDLAPIADDPERFDSLDDADAPPVRNMEYVERGNPMTMPKTTVNMIADNVRESLWVDDRQIGKVRSLVEEYGKQEFPDRNWLFRELKDNFGKHTEKMVDETTQEVKSILRKYRLNVSNTIKGDIADYNDFRRRNFGKVLFSRQGMGVDSAYEELSSMYPSFFPADITNPTDQLLQIVNVANMSGTTEQSYELDDDTVWDVVDDIAEAVSDYQYIQMEQDAGKEMPKESFDDLVQNADTYAPLIARDTPVASGKGFDAPVYDAQPDKGVVDGQQSLFKEEPKLETEEGRRSTRKQLHHDIVEGIKATFKANGFDFDKVLKQAKNLGTFTTVDNMPQRVMEKALGYEEGQTLSDLTVNKVAQNETEGIKWLNSYTDRKSGLLKQLSARYNIKPGSKESAAAQMYAEGFYVAENNDIIAYGDAELAKDFPDAKVQANIKGLANDPRIRRIYDDTLAMINASRTRNAYPEIPRLDNYFLHFRAMDDTFSKLGLPFNPNDIRAKDLPTDLNGVTADLKPGQPYFASAMHRTGKRTSFDLLGGLERYLSSAKNQIYHIDDIQTLRALRNYIADTYGQANGLEDLDMLSEEEAQERIEKVYNSHLSTFAKFLNEEANILAGKTALIDRGLEGIIGRRGITFLDTVNKQVGSNMVGFNLSSSLTNFLPVAQTIAKTNKFDFTKAFAQTVANKLSGGRFDSFADDSPVIIRRKGADRFYRTPWQKVGDAGYVFMSAVDDISTELIARTKFNELTRKGMDAQKAHYETDKWVSRLMGDRSLGQMPQLYNSKMLGLVTKFQLEVRNQLDSQFYDTIQEAKVSNEHIQNRLVRNAKTAAKVTSTFVQLAVVQHLFGKAFESVAGYNPAFDIIDVLIKAFGFDDEEDSEDTVLDNIEQGFLALLEDLPYTSTFMDGGRVPISAALPIAELIKGEDEWGNEKSRWGTLNEIAPYYLMPGGYGQAKKTVKGLRMFSDDHPIAGSYTDNGGLRFPVEDTPENRIQAGIFGQWASENARDYFDGERKPLDEKKTQEFKALGISIQEYWAYQDEAKKISDRADGDSAADEDILKSKYLTSVNDELSELYAEMREIQDNPNLSDEMKRVRIKPIQNRFDELARESYQSYNKVTSDGEYATIGDRYFQWYTPENGEPEWRKLTDDQVTKYLATRNAKGGYATNGTQHYRLNEGGDPDNISDWTKLSDREVERQNEVTRQLGITPEEYWSKTEKSMFPMYEGEYEYAYDNPENYAVAKAVGGYEAYKGYSGELYDIKADKDENGKSISGSRKEKVLDYINNLDADYYTKIILWKSEYPSDDSNNYEIIEYLNGREDISFEETISILRKLGFDVTDDGDISW